MAAAVLFSFFLHNGSAQNPLERELQVFANAVDAEKIYLQLSGTTFDTSQTIWFKAIVTNVVNHLPTNKSVILHVELVDPLNKQIIDSKLLKIRAGVTDSFFQLHSRYREGKYILRAYTEWNKNFGDDFITSIPINIYSFPQVDHKPNPIQDIVFLKDLATNTFTVSSTIFPKEIDSLHTGDITLYMNWKDSSDSILIKPKNKSNSISVQHNVPLNAQIINYRLKTRNEVFTKSIVLDEEYGELQFFPEGGSLVEGLQSIVGFKYVDYRGRGAKIQGSIEDENEKKVADFESNILGMGKLALKPEAEKTYYGVLESRNGNTFKFELPKAKKKGLVLRTIKKKSYQELRVVDKEQRPDSLFVRLFHRGTNLFFLKAKLRDGVFSYRIKHKDLPHGIIGLTVYNKHYKPVAERHFFNDLKRDGLQIKVKTDRQQYSIRDSVKISVSTRQNGQPVQASVCVMAIDSSYFYGTNLDRNTISSYFLIQSDIKGIVENPSYYFENVENLDDLDYLMLTQGWTNYKYEEKKRPKLFQAEKGLKVEGTVGGVQRAGKRKRLKGNPYSINMLIMGEPMEVYTQEIDSTGYFGFMLNDSYGNGKKFVIQPKDTKNKSANFKVNIKRREIPEITYELEKSIVPVDSTITKTIVQKVQEDVRLDPFLLPNAIALDEVEVSDYKLTPERAKMAQLHGMPDVIIDNKELTEKEKNWTGYLYRWLLFNYSNELNIDKVGNGIGFEVARVIGAGFTYVVVDGIPVHINAYGLIGNIPLHAVKSVEIIRNPARANRYFDDVFNCGLCPRPQSPAILAIYTYSGKGLYGAFPKRTNLLNDISPQYSPVREYYMPNYHDPLKIDWNVPDRRRLLYWKPNIITNTEGHAKTTFFNSDIIGKMILICEGIDVNGKVGYSELIYEVTE